MAEKGERQVSGTAAATTLLTLQPVRYVMELHYLGNDRIKHADGEYRCRYTLCDKGSLDSLDQGLVHNVVENSGDEDLVKAALPRDADGTLGLIPEGKDKRMRVMVLDNHGTRTDENLTLLGSSGDDRSNPDYYRQRQWLQDVQPALPFRVIVRKQIGSEAVDFDEADYDAVFEVKDPPEEFEQTDGRRREFLENFFKKYNREDLDPTEGDDNALQAYEGKRKPSHSESGVRAIDVLKKVPYKSPPVSDEFVNETDVVEFSELSAADADGSMNAKFRLEAQDDPSSEKKVGIADLVFLPWPANGDNYRFLWTLKCGSSDVREIEVNGAPVVLEDHGGRELDQNRWYTGPQFTMWRKQEFALLVRANKTASNDIRWADIQAAYRKSFLEIVAPIKDVELTIAKWKEILHEVFGDDPGFDDDDNFTEEEYRKRLFPDWLTTGMSRNDGHDNIESFARLSIAAACEQEGLPDPGAGANQSEQADGGGLAMFLARDPFRRAAFGAYFGDRSFWMQMTSKADASSWATSTCAHEFGHVRSLRHSYTSRENIRLKEGATERTMVVANGRTAGAMDHDGEDAFDCLMAYTRGLTAEPCGMCALSMRFYDRPRVQRDSSGAFRNELAERMAPFAIGRLNADVTGAFLEIVTGGEIRLSVGDTVDLFAFGPERDFRTRSGSDLKGRANYSTLGQGEVWSFRGAGGVARALRSDGEAFARQRVTAQRNGRVTVTFELEGQTAEVELDVS